MNSYSVRNPGHCRLPNGFDEKLVLNPYRPNKPPSKAIRSILKMGLFDTCNVRGRRCQRFPETPRTVGPVWTQEGAPSCTKLSFPRTYPASGWLPI